jgi:hypothetical protein
MNTKAKQVKVTVGMAVVPAPLAYVNQPKALSRKNMAFLFSFFIFALNMFNYSSIVAAVIQAFLLFLQISCGGL